jgi:hypothetical protein
MRSGSIARIVPGSGVEPTLFIGQPTSAAHIVPENSRGVPPLLAVHFFIFDSERRSFIAAT